MKKIIFLLIAVIVLSSVLFAGGQRPGDSAPAPAGQVPSYINLDGYFPVVKPGTNITMTATWLPAEEGSAIHTDPSQVWYFRFVKEAMNINLDVTPRAPGNESKNLMFASGDLPDVWFGGSLSNADIVRYGVGEKMILPVSDYLGPVLTPNLYKLYQDDPELKIPSIAPDGKIYSFSSFRGKDWLGGPITGGLATVFYQMKWLEQLNLKIPETLNEYLEMLRKFKTLGDDILPDLGVFGVNQSYTPIFSALGFHWTSQGNIVSVGTRNGKVTFLYADREIYPKFAETFHTMYREGLISPDFFTMTLNTQTAFAMTGKAGVVRNPVTQTGQTNCWNYFSAKPLTSEFNDKIFWISPSNYVNTNQYVIMARCRTPEVAMRMFDFGYTEENGLLLRHGPSDKQPQYFYNLVQGWTIRDEAVRYIMDNPALYVSENQYSLSRIRIRSDMPAYFGNIDLSAMKFYGLNPEKETFNLNTPEGWRRHSTYQNLTPHAITDFPFDVYWDERTNERLADLSTVLNDYANIQFAQFVTGARPLSDMNRYFTELDAMHYQEYLKIYSDYYDRYKASR